MIKAPNQTKFYQIKREEAQNPFTGFTSFQHFRGEKLYSDIVVTPEAKMTETERVECYPISPDAEENGREQGYYPDSSIAYIRVLWKEFEPEQGVYNYAFIEDILSDAKAHHQTLIFRLMAHSTRACDDVPEWLKKLIPCPERPYMMRIKDSPTHPLFMELFLKAITKLGERFDADPFFEAIDISLPGSWGEGHNLHLYPADLFQQIMDTYLAAFPNTQLMTQVGRPELIEYAWKKAGVRVGWRGDGLGQPKHIQEIYPVRIEKIPDAWKYAPVSFESYWWLCEWQRQGWDLDDIIEKTLSWHISSFNPKSIPAPYEWKDKLEDWISKMGYHYAIHSFSYPEAACAGDRLDMLLRLENIGVAPIYHKIPLHISLIGENKCYSFETDTDITKWMPGKHDQQLSVLLPDDIRPGKYQIRLSISNDFVPMIYFATDAPRHENGYIVGEMNISKE